MPNGYGKKSGTTAHRAAWIAKNGPVPNGKYVLHECDKLYEPGDITYRQCINVDHLRLGTQKNNIDDMWARGRGNRHGNKGVTHHNAFLTEDQVRAVRRMRAEGLSYAAIADALDYVVTKHAIFCIIKGRSWKHLR